MGVNGLHNGNYNGFIVGYSRIFYVNCGDITTNGPFGNVQHHSCLIVATGNTGIIIFSNNKQ